MRHRNKKREHLKYVEFVYAIRCVVLYGEKIFYGTSNQKVWLACHDLLELNDISINAHHADAKVLMLCMPIVNVYHAHRLYHVSTLAFSHLVRIHSTGFRADGEGRLASIC